MNANFKTRKTNGKSRREPGEGVWEIIGIPRSRSDILQQGRLSREHLRIDLRKENTVQARDHLRHISLVDHKADVDLRSALRNHVNVNIRDGAEDLGGN